MSIDVVQTKLISMLVIAIGSFVVGVAPICFVSRVRDLQQKLLLSCTLCFGGGVLLGTSILHMLPEIRESLPNHAELTFACGFLLLYVIDEFVHYFWDGDAQEHVHESHRQGSRNWAPGNRGDRSWGASNQVSYSIASRTVSMFNANSKSPYQTALAGNGAGGNWKSTYGAVQYAPNAPVACNDEATFLCHGNHTEPCTGSNTGLLGLLLALTLHSILEGLAIGLQKVTSEVLLLVGAVASHKFVVGFCLGLELAGAGSSNLRLISAIFVFSSGSAIGIGIGMLTLGTDKGWAEVAFPILQGLAGGTLLYVTVSEVLPRERARWHKSERRSAGLLQFFSTALGFVVIFLLNKYVST